MGSTALTLVNEVLLLTGDYQQVTTIAGNPANIGERIVGFMNLTISEIEKSANWPILRVNSKGTADGVSSTFSYTGSGSLNADAAVSVWIEGQGKLDEVTPAQFDEIFASTSITGLPSVFQRGATTTGLLEIQVYPTPTAGAIVNVSGYRRATRLTTVDTSTTELDDDLIKYGTMMHMDAYDGMDRGYAQLFKESLNSYKTKMFSNQSIRIMPESYA